MSHACQNSYTLSSLFALVYVFDFWTCGTSNMASKRQHLKESWNQDSALHNSFFYFWQEIFNKQITEDLPHNPFLPVWHGNHRWLTVGNVLQGLWIFTSLDEQLLHQQADLFSPLRAWNQDQSFHSWKCISEMSCISNRGLSHLH